MNGIKSFVIFLDFSKVKNLGWKGWRGVDSDIFVELWVICHCKLLYQIPNYISYSFYDIFKSTLILIFNVDKIE